MHDYKVKFQGSGTGISQYGTVQIIDGRCFLCDGDLALYLRDWVGLQVEVAFWLTAENPPFEPDPLITPLVEALQARGVRTLSSCQGHMDKPEQHKYPHVSFYKEDEHLVAAADGWEVANIGGYAMQLRPVKAAETQEELEVLQRQLGLQTDVIRGLK